MEDSITKAVQRRVDERNARRDSQRSKSSAVPRVVTPQHLATAFKDPDARALLSRARSARLKQDAALASYEATSYQRISAWLNFSKLTRDRLVFRTEHSGRIQWKRDVGIWMNVTGSRTVIPGIPEIGETEARKGLTHASDGMIPVPYYPGYEPLWAGLDMQIDEDEDIGPVHPLSDGSEAYYTFSSGDSLDFRLGDGKVVRIRSLEVRPREPKWNLVVGSLWFELESSQLVRAAYRFAVPMHIDAFVLEQDPTAFDDVPVWVKPLMMPMHGEISAVTIEYGMYENRFWLPRVRSAVGVGQASFMRMPFSMEQSFKYTSVNAIDSLPRIQLVIPRRPPDSLSAEGKQAWRDSVAAARREASRARRDSVRAGLIPARRITQCDTNAVAVSTSRFGNGRIPMAVRTPCNSALLEHSPDMPASIFDPGDELFDVASRDALVREALAMGAQPPLTLRPSMLPDPTLDYGLHLTRYNRVEGLSVGGAVEQVFGGGYTVNALGRLSTAEWQPNAEATITRSNLMNSIYVGGYKRLVSAGDWGNPLSFGSSLSGVLFGRDEGFYYRSTGVEFGGRREHGAPAEGRLFIERQQSAIARTDFGLMSKNALPNIDASAGTYAGASVRLRNSHGLDPQGFRVFSDLRMEGAHGDSTYARGALDLTFTKGVGAVAAALTLSGGSSVGAVPVHRLWYLGGTHTIRGQAPDTAAKGNAYWMTRTEVGRTIQGSRVVLFGDLGWTGDRNKMREIGRPLSGVGAGISILDGLLRFDLARGINPGKGWRFDAYIEGVF